MIFHKAVDTESIRLDTRKACLLWDSLFHIGKHVLDHSPFSEEYQRNSIVSGM